MTETTTGPDFAGVLAGHEYLLTYKTGGICTCGHVPTVNSSTLQTQQDYHRAHLSAALHAEVARWLADEGPREVVETAVYFGLIAEDLYGHYPSAEEPGERIAGAVLAALTTTTTPTANGDAS